MVSSKVVRQAIYQRLNTISVTALLANGSASIFHAVAPSPAKAAYPLVVFNKQGGSPVHQFGGSHFDDQIWLVKAITKDSKPSAAEDVEKAIADRLDFDPLPLSAGETMAVIRGTDVAFVETDGDQQYHHRGALYRVVVQQ